MFASRASASAQVDPGQLRRRPRSPSGEVRRPAVLALAKSVSTAAAPARTARWNSAAAQVGEGEVAEREVGTAEVGGGEARVGEEGAVQAGAADVAVRGRRRKRGDRAAVHADPLQLRPVALPWLALSTV